MVSQTALPIVSVQRLLIQYLQNLIGRNLQKKAKAAVIGVAEVEKCPAESY